jgi:hypothetical protein
MFACFIEFLFDITCPLRLHRNLLNDTCIQIERHFIYSLLKHVFIYVQIVVRVAQWLEWRHRDLMILASQVRISMWDVGAGLSDETV